MTLKAKLIGMTTGMALFFALVNYVQFGQVLANQKSVAVERVGSQAAILVNSVASRFFERYVSAQTLALYDALRRDKLNEEEITTLFNTHTRMNPSYDVVLLVDEKGNYVASNRRGSDGRSLIVTQLRSWNYANTPWFRNAFAGQTSDDASKNLAGTFVEDVQLDSISTAAFGENRLGNSFSVPVKNARGETTGVLSIHTNFSWVENEFKAFYRSYAKRVLALLNFRS
jgi:methyl-accepting chemotaxis protein